MSTSRLFLFSAFAIAATPGVIDGQGPQASLSAGVGTVRYEGGSSFASVTLGPALRFESATVSSGIDGTIAWLPDGVLSGQGRFDLWLSTPPVGAVRLAAQTYGSLTSRSDGTSSRAAHALGELVVGGQRWVFALGAGPSAGWIDDGAPLTALHLRARARGVAGPTSYSLSIEPTWFDGAWFTDVSTGANLVSGRLTVAAWAAARLSSAYGSSRGGGAFVQYFLTSRLALEAGGGDYLREPYEGFPRAAFGSFGLRLHLRPRPVPSGSPAVPELVLERQGDSVQVRFRMDAATAVAIAGDWNEWQPQPLLPFPDAVWAAWLRIPPGRHEFKLVVNGSEWVVPAGVAVARDSTGGLIGLLIVR